MHLFQECFQHFLRNPVIPDMVVFPRWEPRSYSSYSQLRDFPSNKVPIPSNSQSDSWSAWLAGDWQGERPGKLEKQTAHPLLESQNAK